MIEQRVMRVLAHLQRNEGVPADAIERAVNSACEMRGGESASIDDEEMPMRRSFVTEMVLRLTRADSI